MNRFNPGEEERHRIVAGLGQRLREEQNVAFAYLYGSFAEGLPFRDVDLGIHLSRVGEEEALSRGLELSQELSREFGVTVDARVINFAPVTFLYHVIRGILIVDRDGETRMRVVERTIQRYLDLKPMIRRGIKEAFGG